MRAIVTLLAIVVIVSIVAVYSGFIKLSGTPGHVTAPSVTADVGSINLGTKEKKVEVPTVKVEKPQ